MKLLPSQRSRRSLAPALVVLACAAPACSKRSESAAPAATAPASPGGGVTQAGGELRVVGRSMRVSLNVSLQVDDVSASADALRKTASDLGGFVAESDLREDRGRVRSASMTLRVQTARLGALRAVTAGLGKITHDSEKAEDVTDQVTDLDARLRNARAREKRLLEMLEGRTGGLADVLSVEKELSSARETVERLAAQKKNLDGEVELATVHLSLGEVGDVTQAGAGARIARAAREGLENVATLLVTSAVVLASVGPSALVLFGCAFGLFRLVRFVHRATEQRTRKALDQA